MEISEEHSQPIALLPKRLKIQETLECEEDEEDRISALPDCLILRILSLLPSTKDAIRTGTLSKRWKYHWTSIPTLIFKHKLAIWNSLSIPTSVFVSIVNETLAQCRRSKLNKFEIFIQYDKDIDRFQSQLNDWIRYVINRNVEELNMTLFSFNSETNFVLYKQLFINSCLRDLKLEGFVLNPKGAIRWKGLRSLYISQANVDDDLIENILIGSPVLETLVLCSCYGFRRLDINSKSVKNLVLCGYENPTDSVHRDVIKINAPNIWSLKIRSDLLLWKLLLLDVSSLVKAELDYKKLGYCETTRKEAKEEMLKGLIRSLHQVKDLRVGSYCSKVIARLEAKGFPFPSSMKYSDTDWLVSELWEIPSLYHLH